MFTYKDRQSEFRHDHLVDREDPTKAWVLNPNMRLIKVDRDNVSNKALRQEIAGNIEHKEDVHDENMEILNEVLDALASTKVFNGWKYTSALSAVSYNMVWKAGMSWIGLESEYFKHQYRRTYDTESKLLDETKRLGRHGKAEEADPAPKRLEEQIETAKMELAYWAGRARASGNMPELGKIMAFFLEDGGSTYEPDSEERIIRTHMECSGDSYEQVVAERAAELARRHKKDPEKVEAIKTNLEWIAERLRTITQMPIKELDYYEQTVRPSSDGTSAGVIQATVIKTGHMPEQLADYVQPGVVQAGVMRVLNQLIDACGKRKAATRKARYRAASPTVIRELQQAAKEWDRLINLIDDAVGKVLLIANNPSDSYNELTGIIENEMH